MFSFFMNIDNQGKLEKKYENIKYHVCYTRANSSRIISNVLGIPPYFSVIFLLIIRVMFSLLASHCPEVDTRWSHEYGIKNFAQNSSRTLTSANQQQKSLRCLPKVTRLSSNTTRWYQECITKATMRCVLSTIFTQRRNDGLTTPYDGYTASCYEHDAF